MAIFQTVCYKIRQNKIFYDMEIFSNFLIFLCSTIANALFLVVIIISIHVLSTYKSQQKVKILLPIAEQEALEVFIYAAVAFKVGFLYYSPQIYYNCSSFLVCQDFTTLLAASQYRHIFHRLGTSKSV